MRLMVSCSYNREGWQALGNIDFNLDQATVEAEDGTAVELGKHGEALLFSTLGLRRSASIQERRKRGRACGRRIMKVWRPHSSVLQCRVLFP